MLLSVSASSALELQAEACKTDSTIQSVAAPVSGLFQAREQHHAVCRSGQKGLLSNYMPLTCHSVDGNVFRSMRSLHLSLESPGLPPKADKGHASPGKAASSHSSSFLAVTYNASIQPGDSWCPSGVTNVYFQPGRVA